MYNDFRALDPSKYLDKVSPGRTATIVVAALNASLQSRAQADFVCDQIADDVEINTALNLLPAGVQGRVVLSEGTFNIVDPIVIPGNNITLRGQGESTFIDGDGLATGEHGIVISGVTSCAIKRLRIQTQDGGGKICHCIFIEDGSNGAHIEEVVIDNSDSDGIHVEGTTMYDISIHDITINGADGYGIFTDMDAGQSILRCHVSHCLIIGTGNAGIYHGPTGAGALYCEWNNNIVAAAGGHGIELHEASYCDSSNNILILSTGGNGMYLSACTHCNLEGNQCYGNLGYGIEIDDSTENLLAGNVCTLNDSGDSGLNNGINLDAGATHNQITANICDLNHGRGINNAGAHNSITGNQCNENDRDGIYSSGAECQINNNHVYDNNQDAKYGAASVTLLNSLVDATLNQFVAGDVGSIVWNTTDNTYATVTVFVDVSTVTLSADIFTIGENYIMYKNRYGIGIGGGGNYCQVNNNYCDSPGDSQVDGIRIEAGADYVQIVGNYCLNGMGDGIGLQNNSYCLLKANYCYDNDGYGINIALGASNTVENNKLVGNVTGAISDGGTGTTLPYVFVPVPNPSGNIGTHPAEQLTDGGAVLSRFEVYVPAEFVELVRAQIILVPLGAGDLVAEVATNFGKVCADEAYNVHPDAIAEAVLGSGLTANDIECIDISAAFTGLAAQDLVGVEFTRHGENGLDTIDANVWLLGLRLQYV